MSQVRRGMLQAREDEKAFEGLGSYPELKSSSSFVPVLAPSFFSKSEDDDDGEEKIEPQHPKLRLLKFTL